MTRRRITPRDDTGASLVLAMAFLTGVGLVVAALLGYSSTAIRSAAATLQHAQGANDVAGGLQAAINSVRTSTFDNAPGENCLGADHTLAYPDGGVVVTCTPAPNSGVSGGLVQIGSSNKPGWALLTLGTNAGEPGIGQSGNNTFWVRGKVQSNSTIAIGGTACPATPQPPADGSNCSELYQSAASTPVLAADACSERTSLKNCIHADAPPLGGTRTRSMYGSCSTSGA